MKFVAAKKANTSSVRRLDPNAFLSGSLFSGGFSATRKSRKENAILDWRVRCPGRMHVPSDQGPCSRQVATHSNQTSVVVLVEVLDWTERPRPAKSRRRAARFFDGFVERPRTFNMSKNPCKTMWRQQKRQKQMRATGEGKKKTEHYRQTTTTPALNRPHPYKPRV